jgi:peptide chain release factor 1
VNWWAKYTQKRDQINAELNTIDIPLDRMIVLQKELAEFEKVLIVAEKAEACANDLDFLQEMLNETQHSDEIFDEILSIKEKLKQLEDEYKIIIRPTKSSPTKIIVEIRPGAGGQEAALFAGLLVEMYKKYAQFNGLDFEVLEFDYSDIDGVSYFSFSLNGPNAYYLMEHESGVHRIQRVPKTESNGRIHTSTATVAVLIEPEETVVSIDENYLRLDVYRASGAGGQHVNKTESAVRLTYDHPDFDKVVVAIQDEKSQHKNKAKAMKILRAKVYEQAQSKANKDIADVRKNQVGTGERFEKIRTYNFPQSRITDHRSGVSIHNIQDEILLLPKDLLSIVESVHEI